MKSISDIVRVLEEIEREEGRFKVVTAARQYARHRKFVDPKGRTYTTTAKKRSMFFRQGGVCPICNEFMKPTEMRLLEVNHHQPLSAGGENTDRNRSLVHASCNRKKGSKDVIDQSKESGETVKEQIERRDA